MIHVRPATDADAPGMAELLNAIIARGGTTALTAPVTADDLARQMTSAPPGRSSWVVALDDTGQVVGFQWIAPGTRLPDEAAEIATFVRVGMTGAGIGSALFRATRAAAPGLGYRWINADIRADNDGGLQYYSARGFRDYGRRTGVVLDNGQTVDKVLKRFDL